jgi:hypothetical protein
MHEHVFVYVYVRVPVKIHFRYMYMYCACFFKQIFEYLCMYHSREPEKFAIPDMEYRGIPRNSSYGIPLNSSLKNPMKLLFFGSPWNPWNYAEYDVNSDGSLELRKLKIPAKFDRRNSVYTLFKAYLRVLIPMYTSWLNLYFWFPC